MKSIARTALVLALFIIPAFASAQVNYNQNVRTVFSVGYTSIPGSFGYGPGYTTGSCASAGIGCVAETILYIINTVLVPLLFAIAFIMFLYGVAKTYIFSHGEPGEVEQGHKLILWGLIGFAVMVSVWGLVNVVANTFGLGGVIAPDLPFTPPTR